MSVSDISKCTWDMFSENINTHKWWLNEKYEEEISLSLAYTDWQEYTFSPFLAAVDYSEVLEYTSLNVVQLYKVTMTSWHYAKEATPKSHMIHIHDIINEFCLTLPSYPKLKKLCIKMKKRNHLGSFIKVSS